MRGNRVGRKLGHVPYSKSFVFSPGGDISAIRTSLPSDLSGAAPSRRAPGTLRGGIMEAGKQIWMLFQYCFIGGNVK